MINEKTIVAIGIVLCILTASISFLAFEKRDETIRVHGCPLRNTKAYGSSNSSIQLTCELSDATYTIPLLTLEQTNLTNLTEAREYAKIFSPN